MIKKTLLNFWLLLLCMIVGGASSAWADVDLFHETFGDNSSSARAWSDSYSVKSGVLAVYSGITGYTVSNVKQGKNTTGSTKSGLNQSSTSTDAYIIIGPLKVDGYSELTLTYQWNAGSIKGTYSTKLEYATSSGGEYTEVSGTGVGATSFVERSYSLPAAAQVSTLYLKITWNTSKTQGIIDEVNLSGVAAPVTHTLTYSATNGTIAGVDASSNAVASGGSIAESATVTLTATPSDGYAFSSWSIEGTGATLSSTTTNPTTFTMGTANATVTANFVELDSRYEANISYTNSSESAVILAGKTHKQTLTNPNSLSVSYTSSDTDVATVASDGTVTLKKAGEVTITASFAGNESFKPGNASYTLTITNKYVADLTFADNALEKLTTDAAFTNTWTTTPSGLDVIFTSSNTSVATVASDGKVTIAGAGETIISATINNASYEATQFDYTLTVSKADAPISFSAATAEVDFDETESFVAPTLSNEQSLTITWSSSDATVASINSSTGAISFLKAGSTTITASSTENGKYKSGSVSYTLTVNEAAENLPFAAAFSKTLGDFTVTEDATLGELWAINSSSAKASAYKNGNKAGESWLISPYINISSDYATLSFQHAGNYFVADDNMEDEATLWIREKGKDWVQLTIATYPTGVNTSTKSSFASTSNSLTSYSGKKVQIGFKYLGNTTSAGSWWVKNFRVADDRLEAPISFADATVYELLKNKDTYTGQALTNEESLTVSYSSSNEDVATVNSSSGVVTIKAVGETNITATYAETASYKANTATYKLVVTSKSAAEIEYAEDAVSKKITLGTYTHTLTNPNDLTVAYASSDETVATVNSSTGEVTMLKVGETTITATFTENEDYDGAEASYTLTVIKDDPTLSFAKATVTAGLADGTYTQAVTTTPAELPVTYTSSDETVGTVASDGTVTLLKAGSTTITASFAGNASYNSASTTYTLTVAINYATLPFSYNSGYSSIGTTLTTGTIGMMQSGLSTSDYGTTNTKLKFDGSGDYVVLKIAEVPGTLSFAIKGNGYSSGSTSTFKVQTSTDGESYTDIATYTELGDEQTMTYNIAHNVRYIKWIYTAKGASSGGNVGLGNIKLNSTTSVTIPASTYAARCYDRPLDYSSAGITVYTAKLNTTTHAVTLTEVASGKVPANEGVIIHADAGTYAVPVAASADALSNNEMVGVTARTLVKKTTDDTYYNYILQTEDGDPVFNMATEDGAYLPANRAYLHTQYDASASLGRLSIVFDDDQTTTIQGVTVCNQDKGVYYNLKGQRVENPKKGELYIVGGKKVIFK